MGRFSFLASVIAALALIIPTIVASEAPSAVKVAVPDEDTTPSVSTVDGEKLQKAKANSPVRADPRRLSETPLNCNTSSQSSVPDKTVTIDEKKLQAKFKCGEPYNTGVVPDLQAQTTTKCCKDISCPEGSQVEFSAVWGVGGKAEKADGDVITVTLAKVPDANRGEKVYYKCKTSGEEFCVVTLALPDKIPDNECAIDRTVNLALSGTTNAAKFKCSGELSETPVQVAEDACSDQAVPNPVVQLQKNGQDEYTARLAETPNAMTKLCYKCMYADVPNVPQTSQTQNRFCNVIVTAAGKAEVTPENKTSTPSTTTNSAFPASAILRFVTASALAAAGAAGAS